MIEMMIGTRQVLVQLQGLCVHCHNLIREQRPRQVGRRMLEICIQTIQQICYT